MAAQLLPTNSIMKPQRHLSEVLRREKVNPVMLSFCHAMSNWVVEHETCTS